MIKEKKSILEKIVKDSPNELTTQMLRTVDELVNYSQNLDLSEKNQIEEFLGEVGDEAGISVQIFMYSAAYTVNKKILWFEKLLDSVFDNKEEIEIESIYYICGQCRSIIFNNQEAYKPEIIKRYYKLYSYVMKVYREYFSDYLTPISPSERNDNMVFVLVEQFLGAAHAPTKSACDRAKILIEKMGKKVILINTAELLSKVGYVPFYGAVSANYNEDLNEASNISWKGCNIPFFQCDNGMPDVETIKLLLGFILEQKPAFVVGIGCSGVVMELYSQIVPTINNGMVASMIELSGAKYITFSGNIDSAKEYISSIGKTEDLIIKSTFVFSLPEQKKIYKRSDFNLKDDDFIIAVVGNRLDWELDDVFWRMSEKMFKRNPKSKYMIVGSFNHTERIRETIKDHIIEMGYAQDLLATLELSDLFLNPKRRGGGTGSVYAMYKGVPVITCPDGDVAINVSEDFWVDDYDEYPDMVSKYINDKAFYDEMTQKAKDRANILLNSEDEFVRIINEFQKRVKESEND